MTNVEGPTSIVCFHDGPSAATEANDPVEETLDYLQARERNELAAAKSARCAKARQAHQELAENYARKIRGSDGAPNAAIRFQRLHSWRDA